MHIHTALLTATPGKGREAREGVLALRDAAVAAHGIPISAWAVVAGAAFGTFAVSTRLESTDQLLSASAALGESDDFKAASEAALGCFTGPADTVYNQIVATTGDALAAPPLISVTRAVFRPGHNRAAMESAAALLSYAGEKANLNGALTLSMAGQMNELNWIVGLDSGKQGDEAVATLGADPSYVELEEAAGQHVESSGERMLLARLP